MIFDGAADNRAFVKMQTFEVGDPPNVSDTFVRAYTRNPYTGRSLWFMSDPPHGMKKWRNVLANPKRNLMRDGKHLWWKHIVELYDEDMKSQGLTRLHKLSLRHIRPSNWDRMNVRVAAQTLSNSVALQLTFKIMAGAHYLTATRDFVQMSNDLFDLINSHTFINCDTMTPVFLDMRAKLDWFLAGVHTQDEKKWLASKTLFDMQMMVEGFIGYATDFFEVYKGPGEALAPGLFNQDALENFFGCIRARGCQNTNPDEAQYGYSLQRSVVSQNASLEIKTAKGNSGHSTTRQELKRKANIQAPIRPEKGK